MNQTEWQARVKLALEGLVPIAWLGRLAWVDRERTDGFTYRGSASDLLPTPEERERWTAVLVEADALAVPGSPGSKRATGLATLARAIVALAAVPGGVTFLGTRWTIVEKDGSCSLESTTVPERNAR